MWRLSKARHEITTTGRARVRFNFVLSGGLLASVQPILDRMACDREDVVARLSRQPARAGDEYAHTVGSGVVGGRGEPQIAELLAQLRKKLTRFWQRLHRIEWFAKPALGSSRRHELRDALCACTTAR